MSPVERILEELRGVKPRGKGWRALCPAHGDNTPSLDIDEGESGNVLLVCRSQNCTAEAICKSIGLSLRDLMPDKDGQYDRKPNRTKSTPMKPPKDWQAEAEKYAAQFTSQRRADLAANLKLPTQALDAVELIGWKADESAWTFPERDETGKIIGITRRYADANTTKKAIPESRRGLTIPIDWQEKPGPVFLVEGPSDTIALTHCGLAAIGRPSNTLGFEQLAQLLHGIPKKIIVVGENDAKPNGNWPGKVGAEKTAKELTARLKDSSIAIAFPPSEHKDCRAWVNAAADGWGNDSDPWEPIGRMVQTELQKDAESKAKKPRFQFIDSTEFASGDFRPQWHVRGILVRRQPAVIAGPSKALKTNVSIDLAVSLASGTEFLGKFPALTKTPVAVVSGESGEHTLQETGKRICRARHLLLDELGSHLQWCFSLPTFSSPEIMREFAEQLVKLNVEVVIIDPVYLALGDVDAKNLFEAGNAFRVVAEVLLNAGCTPILVHHSNRQLTIGEPMELTHLAYSGLEQFARQFILLNRREKYHGNGVHDLWCSIGGSAGHGGLWNLHIEEGVIDENFAGREWRVEVLTRSEVKEGEAERRQEEKRRKEIEKKGIERKAILTAIDTIKDGPTKTAIRSKAGLSGSRVNELLAELIEDGMVEEYECPKKRGSGVSANEIAYKRVRQSEL